MKRRHSFLGSVSLTVFVLLYTDASAGDESPRYLLTDAGPATYIGAVNNQDQLVGVGSAAESYHAFLFEHGKRTDLTALVGFPQDCDASFPFRQDALDINDRGDILLTENAGSGQPAVCSYILNKSGLTRLSIGGFPVHINNQRQVIGNAISFAGAFGFGSTCTLDDIFNPIWAAAINDSGDVVGWGNFDAPYLCRDGKLIPLGIAGFEPLVINNRGQIAGSLLVGNSFHAFYFDRGRGKDLGTLPGDTDSSAEDMNIHGQIVGWSRGADHGTTFLFLRHRMIDVNRLIHRRDPLKPFVTLVEGIPSINDNGVVATIGVDSRTGRFNAYLLTPVRRHLEKQVEDLLDYLHHHKHSAAPQVAALQAYQRADDEQAGCAAISGLRSAALGDAEAGRQINAINELMDCD
jgi:hypothetical protein